MFCTTIYYGILRSTTGSKKVFSKNIIPIHANTVGTAQTINSSTKVFFQSRPSVRPSGKLPLFSPGGFKIKIFRNFEFLGLNLMDFKVEKS